MGNKKILGEVKGHDTPDQVIKPMLEGFKKDGDQIQVQIVKPTAF